MWRWLSRRLKVLFGRQSPAVTPRPIVHRPGPALDRPPSTPVETAPAPPKTRSAPPKTASGASKTTSGPSKTTSGPFKPPSGPSKTSSAPPKTASAPPKTDPPPSTADAGPTLTALAREVTLLRAQLEAYSRHPPIQIERVDHLAIHDLTFDLGTIAVDSLDGTLNLGITAQSIGTVSSPPRDLPRQRLWPPTEGGDQA
jgi:hypothetical protein